MSAADVQKKLMKRQRGKVNVSVRTVQRVAKKGRNPLKYKKVLKKPLLTESHKQRRLAFAHQHTNLEWRRVMFTDSKYFNYYF